MRDDVFDHPHAGVTAQRHDQFGMKLDRCDGFLVMLDAHDNSVNGLRGNVETARQADRISEDRMVAPDGDILAKSGKHLARS